MNSFFKRSLALPSTTAHDPLKEFKRKTLNTLLWACSFIAILIIVIAFILKLTTSNLTPDQDPGFLIYGSLIFLGGLLIIALLERYISYNAASLLFTLLVTVIIFFADSQKELADGRSLIALILPVVIASVLLRPWAGSAVAAFFCVFIIAFQILNHRGWPNIPAIAIIILVSLIIQQATSHLERAVEQIEQTKQTLRAREERFRALVESSTDINAILGRDGSINYVSSSVERLLGYKADDLLGQNIFKYLHPEDLDIASAALGPESPAEAIGPMLILRLRHRNGSWIIVEVIGKEMYYHPTIRGVVINCRDITDRNEAETALRESEEKYRRLIETLPIGVIVHQEGKIQLINPTGAKIMGAENTEAFLGRPVLDLVHPDYQEIVQARIRASMTKGVNAEMVDEKLVRIDGTVFDAEVIALPISLKGNSSMFVMFDDITERKQAESALRKSEENFRNLTENTADGILIGAHDGRHIYANRQACELLGYSPEEMIRTSQMDISDPGAYPSLQKNLQARIAGRPLPKRYETTLRRKDGRSFPVEISGTRTVWQDQTCDLVLFRDITERKQAQEAIESQNQRIQEVSRQLLEVQEREKHLLASELHDDLGQSLTSLKLMLELASSTRTTNKQLEVMGNARELVSELMGKVRDISLDLRPAMLDDFGLFAALRWLFERFHGQTGITIRCNIDLNNKQRFSSPVETAAFRIIQEALTNIARYAGVQKAQVNLVIGENLSIEITDKGTGFDFTQEIQSIADSGGLSGMQERARLLGGQVEIHSEKGSGTRVVAVIPISGETQ